MSTNPVLTHTFSPNDFRPVLQSAHLRHAIRAVLFGTALGLATVPQLSVAADTAEVSQHYAIPAGELTDVLNTIARQAGITLSSTPQLTDGLHSNGLQGQYTADQALRQLLNGNGLEAVSQGGRNYVLQAQRQNAALALPDTDIRSFSLGNALGSMEGYNATHSQVATKTSMPLVETSQSVSVVNPYGATHRYDYVAMRGFNDGSVDNIYVDGLKSMGDNGTYSTMQVDPYFLERIDILKGPSSVLYGRSSPGGLVALTTKKPLFVPYHQVQATVGTQGQRGVGFDFSGPVDDDKRIAYRLTGLADASDTQFDHNKEERYAIAPAISVDFTEDTSLTLQAYLQHDPNGGYHGGNPADGMLHKRNGFNDVFTARQNFRYQDSDVSMDQVYAAGWADVDSNMLNRAYTGGDERLHSYIIDNMLQAEFFTGAAKHTLLLGADYQRRKADVTWRYGTVDPLDAGNPQYGNGNLQVLGENRYQRRLQQTGVYLQDLVELDQWRFSLGLRQDWVKVSEENRDSDSKVSDQRSRFTSRAGVLYLFENGIAPYISYSESFNPNTVSDQQGRPLAPTEGTQWEAGIKYQPPGSDNLFTASVFRIEQENLASKQPDEDFYRPVGEVRSQGLELEAHVQLTDSLKLLGGYTFTDIEYSKSMPSLVSGNLDNKGNSPTQAPKQMLSLWADYNFRQGALDGLRLGGGVRYVGYSWVDAENSMKVPSYTLFDASIGYDLGKVGLTGVDVRLNANNLTNESYITSCASLNYCYMGEERNVSATVSYQF